LCDLVQDKLLCQCTSKFEVLFQIIQSAFQDPYLQKDVPVAKLTPLHILHSVLADEVCVQWYIKESSPDRQQLNIHYFIINPVYLHKCFEALCISIKNEKVTSTSMHHD